MRAPGKYLRTAIVVVLLSGCLVGISGLLEPVLSATEPSTPADQEPSAVTPDSSSESGKGREGKRNHSMRMACAEDAKKLCAEVQAREGRILQCLKQHSQNLSQGCADVMQQRGKHRQQQKMMTQEVQGARPSKASLWSRPGRLHSPFSPIDVG